MEEIKCEYESRFLFFWKHKYISHSFKLVGINRFMRSSETFHAHYECSICGLEKEESFVEADRLLKYGLSAETLNSTSIFYVDVTKELNQ